MSILSVNQISPVGSGTTITLTSTETKTGSIISVGTGASVFSPAGNTLALGTNNVERIRIKNDGKVGIGTNNPQQMLEVQDRSGGTLCGLSVGTQYGNAHFGGYNNYPAIMNSSNQPLIYCDTNNDRTIFFGDTVGFGTTCAFRVNGAERLRITSDGKIGINENNPTLSFVMSSANQSHAMRVNNTNTNSSYTTLSLKNTQNDFQMWLQGPGGSSYAGTNGVAFYQGLTSGSYGPYVFYHGTTRRVSVDTDGDLTIVDGNLSVASGHGIDFSATSDGSGMTSELLDDYEEGYFVPTLDAPNQSSTGFVHFHNHGYYTKVGNIVNVTVYIQGYASSNASGGSNDDIKIIGLPFAPAVLPGSGSSNRHAANWTFGTTYKVEVDRLEGYTYGGNTYIDLLVPSNGGTGTMLKSNQINQNTCQFWCTATYRV